MARQDRNVITHNMSGHIGKEIVFRQYRGRTIVAKYPDMSNVVPSKKQKKNTSLMGEASAFGKAVMANRALITDPAFMVREGQSLYHAAVSWFWTQRRKH